MVGNILFDTFNNVFNEVMVKLITISEMEVFMKEFGLKDEKEFLEARYNLLGFFNTLYKIDQRLKRENNEYEEKSR